MPGRSIPPREGENDDQESWESGSPSSARPASSAGAALLVPGMWVYHPGEPDWGPGQIQSVIGQRITVNFENAGKRLINGAVITLLELGEGAG